MKIPKVFAQRRDYGESALRPPQPHRRLPGSATPSTNGDLTKAEVGNCNGTLTAASTMTQISYDAIGRVACAASRMNPGTYPFGEFNACILGTTGSFGPDRITKTLRDANGRPTEIKAAFGVVGEEASALWPTATTACSAI